ncbi:MAG: hypothetical protein ACYDDI_07885 [Candidatus Acidiferrales bacterium]
MEKEQFLTVTELDNNPELRAKLHKKWDEAPVVKPHRVPQNGTVERMQAVNLRLDSSALDQLLATLPKSHVPSELFRRRVNLFLDFPQELLCLKSDLAASGAGELVIRLEPTESLRELVFAFRADSGNGGVII